MNNQKENKMSKKTIVIIAVVVIILIIGFASGNNNSSKTNNNNNNSNNNQEENINISKEDDDEDIPMEYKNALKQAESYSEMMHMSKQGIYDQLVSEYGGQFPAEAAQYAIDNIDADWNANALAKAKDYR